DPSRSSGKEFVFDGMGQSNGCAETDGEKACHEFQESRKRRRVLASRTCADELALISAPDRRDGSNFTLAGAGEAGEGRGKQLSSPGLQLDSKDWPPAE